MRTQLTPKRFSISIHSLRMEGDISTTPHVRRPKHFNPLPPHGGRHDAFLKETFYNDFNPLPPHGGRRQGNFLRNDLESISIHSLRMEGDSVRTVQRTAGEYFNPLPPHGGRHTTRPRNDLWWTFQSTPSAWRETCRRISACPVHRYFNPLPPHGGRPCSIFTFVHLKCISIHSLRMEGDVPVRPRGWTAWQISIHSLRMEGDAFQKFICLYQHISIHSLRMEGDANSEPITLDVDCISIHSLRMEGDPFRSV